MKKSDLDKIKAEIQKHDFSYYTQDRPTISDFEYDQLFSRLLEIESQNPQWISPSSPSQRVGSTPLEHFEKLPHRLPMLSLQNSYDDGDILKFDERIKKQLSIDGDVDYLCEPKLDGLALEIIYEDGQLTGGLTRGDGRVGENVLSNVKTIRNIPTHLPVASPPDRLEVRGEVVILKEDFLRLNESQQELGLATFANPRNAAAGTIRQLNPKISRQRPLRFYAYSAGSSAGIEFSSQIDFLNNITRMQLPTLGVMERIQSLSSWSDVTRKRLENKELPAFCLHSVGVEPILQYYRIINELRPLLPFDIDGIVIKVNSYGQQKSLGQIAKSPRWATAAKFEPEQAQTIIHDIVVQVGRTGALTPVAIMDPVSVGGVVVSQATLHNQDEIDRKDVRIGDQVIIQRAGDVIPEVVSVLSGMRPKGLKKFAIPQECPSCNQTANRLEGEVIFRCLNPLCPAIFSESVKHFVSRKAMNVDKLGDKIIQQLVEKKIVTNFSDIYTLDLDQLLSLSRQGQKSAANILKSINKSRKPLLGKFIFSLGVRFVGERTAHILADHFLSLEKLLESSEEELLNIDDIGPKVSTSILKSIKNPQFIAEVTQLIDAGIDIKNPKTPTNSLESQILKGLSIVVTGSLPKERGQIKSQILALGGKSPGSVSKKTDYLLAGDAAGSKLAKAQDIGIKIINWEEYQSLIKTT